MALLGIISGTIIVERSDLLKNCRKVDIRNEYGQSFALVNDAIALIPRHGNDPAKHILPHTINYRANLKALRDLGVAEVVGINSTGSLKKNLSPGMIVIPDDFIMTAAVPAVHQDKAVHITPALSEKIRQKLIAAAGLCKIQVIESGTYWQTIGPRLETKAEIRMMSCYADIVGMTMASEAVLAQELDLAYASVCSVDNYGNGLAEKPLSMDEIIAGARKNADLMVKIVTAYLKMCS